MSKRYFINNIDTFLGQQLLQELFKQPEDADPIDPSEYKIMATYTDHYRIDKQAGVKKILKRYKPKLSRKKILEENDVWIYNLNNNDDLKFISSVIESVPQFEEQKILVLLSDVRAWGKTPKKIKKAVEIIKEENEDDQKKPEIIEEQKKNDENNEDGENKSDAEEEQEQLQKEQQNIQQEVEEKVEIIYESLKESDYKLRVPLEQFQDFKNWEDHFMQIQKENLKIIVICSGILYGSGEIIFKNHFQAAWKQNPIQLPYLNSGDNLIPTIYVKDLIKFIIKVSESPPETPQSYLLAIDNSKNKTQKAIINAISKEVGSGKTVSVKDESMFTEEMKQCLTLDLDLRPSYLLVGEDEAPVEFEWTCEKGLTTSINVVLKEFKKSQNLRPLKILVYFPENQKNDLDVNSILTGLSQSYNIPIITIEDVLKSVLDSQNDLQNELQQNYQSVLNCIKNEKKQIDETTKLLFRSIKQRLMNNDCSNRGFILVNCPQFIFDCEISFYNQKNRLKSKKPKEKTEKKLNEDGEEIVEAEEEEQPEEVEGGEDEEGGPKQEDFFPESIIILKCKLLLLKALKLKEQFYQTAFNFFKQKNLDIFIYDPTSKTQFEISESLRVYIERKGRPFNYIKDEQALKIDYDAYYAKVNSEIQAQKQKEIQKEQQKKNAELRKTGELLENVFKSVQKEFNNQDLKEKTSLRQFLMQNIVPSLSDGLLEVSKVKPQDPVEFLAEYLFQQSFDLQ